MLMRILFSSCADNFEIFIRTCFTRSISRSPRPEIEFHSDRQDVLDCSTCRSSSAGTPREAEEVQRGSVKGFISDNKRDQVAGSVRRRAPGGDRENPADQAPLRPSERGSSTIAFGILSCREPSRRISMTLNEFLDTPGIISRQTIQRRSTKPRATTITGRLTPNADGWAEGLLQLKHSIGGARKQAFKNSPDHGRSGSSH